MFIIGIISIVIYIIATLMIWTNIYEFEKEKKIKFILIGMIVIFIVTWIIVSLCSNGIQVEKSYLKVAKTTSLLIFAPINTIFVLPYLGNIFNKYKQKRLSGEKLKKRLIILGVALFIVIIIETNYIKTFELGLLSNVMK
ncbi:MAG: hypothetical protein J6A04_02040 [Clostridia bacterium]|nr:hypothetical protein [Clostridia bacterium]